MYNNKENAAQQYLTKQIQNATPAEQIVMLYDGAIRFLLKAKAAIEKNDIQERFNNNKRAGDIILYLMAILDHEKGGEISVNLERNYLYMSRRLMEVDMKNSAEPIDDVVSRLKMLRTSWEKIAKGEVYPETADEKKSQASKEEGSAISSESKSAIA